MRFEVGKCRLRQIMRKKGVSQVELATRLQRPESQISAWVNTERVMSLLSAYEVAQVLGCSMEDLYDFNRRRGTNE